jgi:DNA polymerase I
MTKLQMPNIRKIFVPDPGYILIDADLKGADARVVAWESDDPSLKEAFRNGTDIHTFNAKQIFQTEEISYKLRQHAKVACHAINYGCKARTLSEHIQVSTRDAEAFIGKWFQLHPRIRRWHKTVEQKLFRDRKITNQWGYTRPYFDRPEGLLPEALAWLGQSTTAIAINKLIVRLDKELKGDVQILLQTHDSVTFQVYGTEFPHLWPRIKAACRVTVPYPDDPMEMPVEFQISEKSWGDLKEYKG